MSGFTDKLTGVHKFLDILSWKKIFQLAAFLFVVALAYGTYELRESIYNYANQTKISKTSAIIQKISKQSMAEVDEAEKKSDLIIAIQVVIIDFQKNVRIPVYTASTHPELKRLYDEYKKNAIAEVPLFSGDVTNNKHLIELINGEFTCYPFSETLVSKVLPESGKFINTACAIGVPPYYGKFSGSIVFYLKRAPTPSEVEQIRALGRTLSANIYDRDIR